jgi:hypothetical protein
MEFMDSLRYVRWFLSHVDRLEPLLDLPARLRAAETLEEKWALLRSAGDLLVEVWADFPLEAQQGISSAELQQLAREIEAAAIPWERLIELLPLLLQLLDLFRKQS